MKWIFCEYGCISKMQDHTTSRCGKRYERLEVVDKLEVNHIIENKR